MKKIILTLVCLLFLIAPVHISNTGVMELTQEEETRLRNKIERYTISNRINDEYLAFYNNLDSVNAPKFVVEFYNKIMCSAIDSKTLPSISMAQASLETGYGRYNKLQNNIFGIKGRGITTKTKEFYKGRFITIRANFQYFPTLKSAFDRHHQILNRYGAKGGDYNFWIDRIVACGYATDPNYDKKLNTIIDRYQLYRLDRIQKLTKAYNNVGVGRNPTPIFTYKSI